MRLLFVILSCVLHVIFLTWMFLHAPNVPKPATEPVTRIELAPAAPASTQTHITETTTKPSSSTSQSPVNSTASTNPVQINHPDNTITTGSSPGTATPTNQTATAAPKGLAKITTDHSGGDANLSPQKSSTPTTVAKAAASTVALLNRPKTSELICSSTGKKHSLRGSVIVNVQMDTQGHVKSASIANGNDIIMNASAMAQAKQLQFPIMRNADNVAVESYSNVRFTFDCSNN